MGGLSFSFRCKGLQVPPLAEALERYPELRYCVDAKSEDPALAEALVRTVKGFCSASRVCLGSFFDAQAQLIGGPASPGGPLPPSGGHQLPCHGGQGGTRGHGCPQGYDLATLPHRFSP